MVAALTLSGCGVAGLGSSSTSSSTGSVLGSVLGGVLGSSTGTNAISGVLSSVLGLDKLSQANLVGTWRYGGPGCAFTTENALAKAGGEVVASQIESKLKDQYSKLGFSSSNTYITFNSDNTFSGKIDGKSWSGTYTYDESTGKVNLKGLLLSVNAYAKGNGSGISLLFEAKKLLSLLQMAASLSGNTTLSTIGDISKNYDGVRLGFDMTK